MSDFYNINNDLEKIMAPINEIARAVKKAIPPEVRALHEALDKIIPPEIQEFNKRINELIPPELLKFNKQLNSFLDPISEYIKQYNVMFLGFAEKFERWQSQNRVRKLTGHPC